MMMKIPPLLPNMDEINANFDTMRADIAEMRTLLARLVELTEGQTR
jgi:hypothetical protein